MQSDEEEYNQRLLNWLHYATNWILMIGHISSDVKENQRNATFSDRFENVVNDFHHKEHLQCDSNQNRS